MAGDQPVGIVPGGEIEQRQAQLLDGLEVAHPQEVFLQRTDEALGDAVALGLAHEGRRGLDAEEGDLALEVVGHVVRSVVVAEHEAGGHVLADGAEVPAHTLADRFQGLEAVGALVGVDADAFAVAVVDGDETWATPSASVTLSVMSVSVMHQGAGRLTNVPDRVKTLVLMGAALIEKTVCLLNKKRLYLLMQHIHGGDRNRTLLLPAAVDDYVGRRENAVRFIEAFVDQCDLQEAGFRRVQPKDTGRPGYDPADLLKLYIYGYVDRVRSSRRLEVEPRAIWK